MRIYTMWYAFKITEMENTPEYGEWTRELIWISEFEKTGYTAPARMIGNNENSNL